MTKKRRKKRRVPPPPATRLDERLTALDLDKLERELAQFLEKSARPKGPPQPLPQSPEPEAAVSHRHLDVPEAEVTIVRRANAARPDPRAAEPDPPPVPPPFARRQRHRDEPAGEHAPRGAYDGVVEEATVVIIRRTPQNRTQ